MRIGERIKLLREDLELTKADLGRLVGVTDVTVLYWERGDIKEIGNEKVVALCRALGCSADELLGIQEDEE